MEIGDSTRTSAALLDGISAVLQISLPDHGLLKADELFFTPARTLR